MSKRVFNVAGPCVPGRHYMLDPLRGISGELMDLIDSESYFVIHMRSIRRKQGKKLNSERLISILPRECLMMRTE